MLSYNLPFSVESVSKPTNDDERDKKNRKLENWRALRGKRFFRRPSYEDSHVEVQKMADTAIARSPAAIHHFVVVCVLAVYFE
jgi:hypothetical protein